MATAIIERFLSTMNFVKNRIYNHMEDGFLNDLLVTYIKNNIFDSVDNKKSY